MSLQRTIRVDQLSPEELAVYRRLNPGRMPEHIAIIMDGNGRWAGKRSLKRFFGHQQGAETVRLITQTAARIGIPWLTLYAFSLENNLKRPRTEVNFLMRLLRSYLEDNVQVMLDNNIQLRYIGRVHELPPEVQDKLAWAENSTAKNTGTVLTLALNYGARSEIVDAFRGLYREMQQKGLSLDHLSEADIHRHLYTAHMPDPDLLIRTSGEMRISNYLLWQIAYTEIYVTDRFWPDFEGVHFLEAIENFQSRERRFGGLNVGSQTEDSPRALAR